MSNNSSAITIIQMTRFGDILQTIWAIKELKIQNPEVKVNLVARKRFGKPLLFLLEKYFDNIHLLDPQKVIAGDITEGLDQTLEVINSWNTKVLVNLSFSKSSAYLSSLIASDFKLGLIGNQFGGTDTAGTWSQYVYSTVMRGPLNPFSLIDIFKFILGVKGKATLPERKVSGNKITIHPFASQERKAWNSNKWSEIIYTILKNNPEVEVSLVGAKNDESNAKSITSNPLLADYSKRIKVECGTLNFEELYNTLSESFLFCGHDSMVGHMASLTGVQCLTLSLGSVRPDETTPYGLNNYVISPKTDCFPCFPDDKCSEYKCHKDLGYKVVAESIQQLIDTNTITSEKILENISPLHLSSVNIYQSTFSQSGLFSLTPVTKSDSSTEYLYKTFYKIVWLFMLEGQEENTPFPSLNKLNVSQLEGFIPNLKQLFELSEFGKKYSRFILEEISKETPDVEYIKSCGVKIEEIDQMQVLVGKASPALNPIVDFFNLKKSSMTGNNLVELCSSSFEIYQGIGSFCNIMYELIEKTLEEYNKKNKTISTKEIKE